MARPKREIEGMGEESAKKRILDAAEVLFSTKGFDSSTIGEIAKMAGVNSALLYYYFTNKEAILHEMMASAVKEVVELVENIFGTFRGDDEMMISKFMEDVLVFLQSKKNALKIMLYEIMRRDRENSYIFELLSPVYELASQKIRQIHIASSKTDANFLRIKLFFIYTAPLMLSVAIGDEWRAYHNIGEKEFHKKFLDSMKELAILLENNP